MSTLPITPRPTGCCSSITPHVHNAAGWIKGAAISAGSAISAGAQKVWAAFTAALAWIAAYASQGFTAAKGYAGTAVTYLKANPQVLVAAGIGAAITAAVVWLIAKCRQPTEVPAAPVVAVPVAVAVPVPVTGAV
jgi:hypothetical protein